jgi:glycosyltransferase involved in cell wall biosynthesis
VTRILWHSAAPTDPSGYGQQTAIWTRYLQSLGHDVAISTYHGLAGVTSDWYGMPWLPRPIHGNSSMLMRWYAAEHKAELVIILADIWTYNPALFQNLGTMKVAAWTPVDTAKLSLLDMAVLMQSPEVKPIAMSEAGLAALQAAGFDPLYVPHGIDTFETFTPPANRETLRAAQGIGPHTFIAGINANNIDPMRKALPEQMAAFARFHAMHTDSQLWLHTINRMEGSLDLEVLAVELGIKDAVRLSDQRRMLASNITPAELAQWYGCLDVLMNATYGEGFGLPAIEAQACGTPVILSRNTTGPQLAGPGWLVKTHRRWNWVHQAWWSAPDEDQLVAALERAYRAQRQPFKRDAARIFAEGYDVSKVAPYWDEALAALGA